MSAKLVTYRGDTRTVGQWLKHFGIKRSTYDERRRRKWNLWKSLSAPVNAQIVALQDDERSRLLMRVEQLGERVEALEARLAKVEAER